MTSIINDPNSVNTVLAAAAATLAGAALGLTAHVVLSDNDRREVIVRLVNTIGLPELARGAGAAVLRRIVSKVEGFDTDQGLAPS